MAKQTFKIGKKIIKENGDIFIIAEAGVNHNSRLDLALRLVDAAADSGADAVKFQTFKPENVVTPKGKMATYQKRNLGTTTSQLNMLRKLALPDKFYKPIIERCHKRNILFLSTPQGGRQSVNFLERFKLPAYKIDSGNLTNYLLLDHIARLKKPIILSTGMASYKEIKDAVNFVKSRNNHKIAILHCTTDYPCQITDVNLEVMERMMSRFDVPVGYSDHSQDIQVAIMIASMGAAVYEFHITLDKKLQGPDHHASSNPSDAKAKIMAIRKVKIIMGSNIKPAKCEIPYIKEVRRSLVYINDLKKGQILTLKDIEGKRPATGISARYYQSFLGKKLIKDVKIDQQLSKRDFI
ncbi:hypothetical protein A3C23_00835 [Candidatus Roizmanbacteria bacterium RIFCSPHIGHO2_02_FULL_37_13b]|uniref:AFP-like domain-containing protein n=1 Tax=Candidatus Roizmanbacteria bacterium RIFCSPLOWO2_02_FULL_36_11 TaxID=1802071 RepID=A0A1F7JIZ3_9BACT|nr:MAG: hypothetical protein A3C23_00835 [Candidatus Roizmanbacteria bacterium RIFCSPHIGHO2_02_FULL_37_13b]OGK55560.1 MAG: hypothetical protein A3H78_05350 [Candidatus Roizmanbacteria bacterium RIFCSPLOWO2_02_FULL_36_11]